MIILKIAQGPSLCDQCVLQMELGDGLDESPGSPTAHVSFLE